MAKAAVQAARLGTIVPPRIVWKNRLLRVAGILSGTYVMFLASLELIRLQLPYDPWQADAAAARQRAEVANPGQRVSMWFGPKGYRAVEYPEWKRRVDERLRKGTMAHDKIQVVKDGYSKIREQNRELGRQILKDGLDEKVGVPPTTKHAVFTDSDRKLQQHQSSEDFRRSDDEGEEEEEELIEWDNMMPWENLRAETDVQIRLIPHTHGVLEDEPEPKPELDGEVSSIYLSIEDDENTIDPSDRT